MRPVTRTPPGKAAGLAATLILIIGAIAGCGASRHTAATAPQPPVVPGQATSGPDLSGVQLPNFVMPLTKGGVSRPNQALTPGAVYITDPASVCAIPVHGYRQPIPYAVQTAVYEEYGYTTPAEQHKYILNYLVPLDLGGSTSEANIWPVAVRGTGFYQKVETDHMLRELVCRQSLSLADAVHLLEADWYSAWLRYVVATGHA